MMKNVACIVYLTCVTILYAQLNIDPASIKQGNANPNLQEISLETFEESGFWRVHLPIDDGVIIHQSLVGSPDDKDPLAVSSNNVRIDERVLGVRADFFRRSIATLSILPRRPIPIPGLAHTMTIWVAGRNTNHELKIVLRDIKGNIRLLSFGKLNFLGWKKLTVAIPPGLQDELFYDVSRPDSNLEITSLIVESELLESYGRFYIYFDDLRAVSDLSVLEREPDDMVDNW